MLFRFFLVENPSLHVMQGHLLAPHVTWLWGYLFFKSIYMQISDTIQAERNVILISFLFGPKRDLFFFLFKMCLFKNLNENLNENFWKYVYLCFLKHACQEMWRLNCCWRWSIIRNRYIKLNNMNVLVNCWSADTHHRLRNVPLYGHTPSASHV